METAPAFLQKRQAAGPGRPPGEWVQLDWKPEGVLSEDWLGDIAVPGALRPGKGDLGALHNQQ